MARDDFPPPVKLHLSKRVNFRCSRRQCRRATSGPHSDINKSVSIGVAAHITAASPGGPRYDATLTPEFRASAENGIWLCQTCSTLIDKDDPAYPVSLLNEWKRSAEERALKELEEPGSSNTAQVHLHVLQPRPQGFTGRVHLIERVQAKVRNLGERFLLHGEPGNGKSLTALECAWQLKDDFDAVVFLPCGKDRTAEAIGLDLASKLPNCNPKDPPETQILNARRWLGGRRTLLVLDDVWSDDLTALIPDQPISMLLTSRQSQRFDLPPEARADVEGFTQPEREEFFDKRLPKHWPKQKESLLDLARRFEGWPYALAVAASLFERNATRPFREVIESLAKPGRLKDGTRDVTGLLYQAVEGCSADAQSLLTAIAFCSPQGVWLPFAAEVAGMTRDAAHDSADELVQAALLRVIDQEEERVGIHALLGEVQRIAAVEEPWRSRHANSLSKQFGAWRNDNVGEWQNCRRIGAEGDAALDWFEMREDDEFFQLAYNLFELNFRTGDVATADAAIVRYRRRSEVTGDKLRLSRGLGNRALIFYGWGKFGDALALHKQQETICRDLGDLAGLSASLGNQALIFLAWGRLDDAFAFLKEQEKICRDLGDMVGLQRSLGNQAVILQDWSRFDDAFLLLKQHEKICRDLGDLAGLQSSLGNQAQILNAWGRLDDAMALLKQQEELSRALGELAGVSRSLSAQALILKAWGKLVDALALHKQVERICRNLGDLAGLASSLANQASIHQDRQPPDFDTARKLASQALQIFTDLSMPAERDQVRQQLDSLPPAP